MDSDGTTNMDFAEQSIHQQQQPQQLQQLQKLPTITVSTPDIPPLDNLQLQGAGMLTTATQSVETSIPQGREGVRDIPVKVHIRRPDRDTWVYLGRAIVTQETIGRSQRIRMSILPVSRPVPGLHR